MHIKFVQKTSIIDYPNTIASTIFVGGCNLNCGFCYNQDLITNDPTTDIPESQVLTELQKRANWIDGVVITGGEPTIQDGLESFIIKLKAMNLKVKLDTNGLNPKCIESLLQNNLIDYIAMDIKAPLDKYEQITSIKVDPAIIQKSIQILKSAPIPTEFRTTIWKEAFQIPDILQILNLVKGAKSYYLQNFYNKDQSIKKGDSQGEIFPLCAVREDENV